MKRYDLKIFPGPNGYEKSIIEKERGYWVKWEDVRTLLAEGAIMWQALEKIAADPNESGPQRWWRKTAREALETVSTRREP